MKLGERLHEIYSDFEDNVTQIYGRRDGMFCTDLALHSILQFRFQGRDVKRGWVEFAYIGDTRTGKTQMVTAIMKHYGLGEMITGENLSVAGLVGGLEQSATSKTWHLHWGRWPLNDMGAIGIDEWGVLKADDIDKLRTIRSEGVAQVFKIRHEKTLARTRVIWIANAKKKGGLAAYSQGCAALLPLFGKEENISRADIFCSAVNSEVPLTKINAVREKSVDHKYTKEKCQKLLLWAWSRKSHHVIIPDETEKAILDAANETGKMYSDTLPILSPAEARIKLARLSVACAARFFSTDDGQNLIVTEDHVTFIFNFLKNLYKKRSFGYDVYSQTDFDRKTLKNIKELEYITGEQAQLMLEYASFLVRDFTDIFGSDDQAKLMVQKMIYARGLKRVGTSYYEKTPAFIEYLKHKVVTESMAGATQEKF